jgi:hypothetical protein
MVISTSKHNVNGKLVTSSKCGGEPGLVKVMFVFDMYVDIESRPDDVAGGRSHFLVKGGEIGGGKKGQTKGNNWQ